ncbi:hypothetical protein T492DRAFT_1126351 [Pavlovales sp. CCMP2436]|nr:hypothetical protein T492DRAFT_1126351 [Pavlovales sp. CCMP2436]
MVKGHPTIAVEMAKTCGMTPLIGVQYYIDKFDTIVKETSEYYSPEENNILDDGDVKLLFNAIIYGAQVTKNSETPYEKKGSTASYWFQIIENHILHIVAVLLLKKGEMLPYRYRLEYDGLCIPPFKIEYDKDKLIEEINTHIYQMTGLAISFKFKNYKLENI